MDAYGVSPSSSSISEKYDVFLSFRGEDTRNNFTSHLYAALKRKKIKTYIDEESLERGDDITLSIPEAIQKANISIIIFSKSYASSSWCLRELVQILKCRRENKRMVIPIFYEVDPSHIRKQEGSYEKAFLEHEVRFKNRIEIVKEWRAALTESADLSSWDSQVTRPDSELVDEVVEDVLKKLCSTVSSSANVVKGLIGMEKHFQQVELLLSIGTPNVRIIGLWGMGGIGKTTIANAVFGRFFSHFESCCFLKNVREESERVQEGLEKLRKKLFAKLLEEENVDLETPSLLDIINRRLKRTRVLIVLDDVSKSEQIEHLVGDGNRLFASGSRILITTRDQKVLRTKADEIETYVYQVEQLNYNEALELFNLTALNKGKPPTSDFTGLSEQAVYYTRGNPLAIKALGSDLRSLREPNREKWEMTLKRFIKCPPADIRKVFKMSYDELEENEKNIFLDIACFFKGMRRDFVENVLNGCEFFASIGIDILIDKSLITTDPCGNELQMHDSLVQEQGREIVCRESNRRGERSRLWIAEDIFHVLENNDGTENIQGIFLDLFEIEIELHLQSTSFRKMHNLRLLKIHDSSYMKKDKLRLQDLQYLPHSLRYLEWHGYPLKSLPPKFNPMNLVELKMPYSQLEHLWDGVQDLIKLRGIDLSHSIHLTQSPNLSGAPNLERINLGSCTSLHEFHFPQNLNALTDLNLRYCNKLRSVRDSTIFDATYLTTLTLNGCFNLNTLPMSITRSPVSLDSTSSGITSLPSSIDCLDNLSKLSLDDSTRLANLLSCMNKLFDI